MKPTIWSNACPKKARIEHLTETSGETNSSQWPLDLCPAQDLERERDRDMDLE